MATRREISSEREETAVDAVVGGDLPTLLAREWLEPNGLGGYASSTVSGTSTRRYHALLVAATDPPVGRMALVAKLEETLVTGTETAELATDLFLSDLVHPEGYRHLDHFTPLPAPSWTFRVGNTVLRKTVAMIHGRNLTVVRYALGEGSPAARLDVRVLVAGRDHHAVVSANPAVRTGVRAMPGLVYIPLYAGVPSVWLGHDGVEFRPERNWYYGFLYPREHERGLEEHEDLLSVGVVVVELRPGVEGWLALGTEPAAAEEARRLFDGELQRRATSAPAHEPDRLLAQLWRATDAFLVRRDVFTTVIAGYPWFTDWGRDTFISLPGLTLVTGRFEVARQILAAFAPHVREGLVPNVFPDGVRPAEYNTIDASLWFINAAYRYVCYTEDRQLLRDGLFDALTSIIESYERGTRYGIREEPDGLVTGGAEGVQLTWMDAKVGDDVITPRRGKPVEISALWYNALRALAELAGMIGRTAEAARLEAKAARTRESFNVAFWNPASGCLYDVLADDGRDASIRPNQLFAASLPFPVLESSRQRAVLDVVERRLLTPMGLRTLDPADPQYRGRFIGGPRERDSAYHQGTVWPWLFGPYVSASVHAAGGRSEARRRARGVLAGLEAHMGEAGIGSVCEVADGDPPHRPGGCYFQAWSVAEPLRALYEDVLGRGPRAAR